jgi:hypothetical protein
MSVGIEATEDIIEDFEEALHSTEKIATPMSGKIG